MPAATRYDANREPSLEELLQDPLLDLILRRDRLTVAHLHACIEDARRRLRSRARPPADRRPRLPANAGAAHGPMAGTLNAPGESRGLAGIGESIAAAAQAARR